MSRLMSAMALSGHDDGDRRCLLLEVKQKLLLVLRMSVPDPKGHRNVFGCRASRRVPSYGPRLSRGYSPSINPALSKSRLKRRASAPPLQR